jgi:hypothetical protein
VLDDSAVAHYSDLVGEVSGHGEIVGYEKESHSERALEFDEEIGDLRLHRAIQGGKCFVEDEKLRIEREGARDGEPLALTAA